MPLDLQKISVKFFVAGSSVVRPEALIPVFNSWIQGSDGRYYDVADYSHIHAGPGIVLIAYEANVSLDENGNRPGLLYSSKQPLRGSNRDKLRSVFGSALDYCRRIEKEPALDGRVKFLGNEALLFINDRLLAPNTEETFDSVKADLKELARAIYGGAHFTLEHDAQEPRKRFGVQIRTAVQFDVTTLLNNLNNRTVADSAGWPAT